MKKSQAIKERCLYCMAGSSKEVPLCHLADCELWPYRSGYSSQDKRYAKRIESAKRRFPEEYQEVQDLIRERLESAKGIVENPFESPVPKLPKSEAIRLYCRDCSCFTPMEVTLCEMTDCSLWPYRCGYSVRDKRYKKRMKSAKRRYPARYAELMEAIREGNEGTQGSSENAQIDIIFEEIAA